MTGSGSGSADHARPTSGTPRLGELLVRAGKITAADLKEALEAQVIHGGRLGTNLLELGLVEEKDLAAALGQQHRVQHASGKMEPDPRALELVTADFADEHDLLPMRVDPTRLSIAVLNPQDLAIFDELAFQIGRRVIPVVVPEFRMNQLLRAHCKAFRPLRAIDLEGPKKRQAEGAAEARSGAGPELMSEDEFQSLYAQVLSGGGAGAAQASPVSAPANAQVTAAIGATTHSQAGVASASVPPTSPTAPASPPYVGPGAGIPAQPARPHVAAATPSHPGAPHPSGPGPILLTTPKRVPAEAQVTPASPPAEVAPPTPLSFQDAQAKLSASNDREQIAQTVLRFAIGKWKRALLLSVQGEYVLGWHGMGAGVREAAVHRIAVPLRPGNTFRLVRDTRAHFVGPLKRDAATLVFAKLFGGNFPTTAVMLPLLVRGKVVHMLYVDNGPDQLTTPDVGELMILSQSVARSYEVLLQKRARV